MSPLPILVLEDSFLVAASLEDALRQAGHKVVTAGTVAEAEACSAGSLFQAALLDFMLPDGNSLHLARQLHAEGCRVAMFSGADREVVPCDPAIAAHFAKPMDERDLIAWVGASDVENSRAFSREP
jgi:DNA-binding response OmpR family regulator